MNRKFTHGPGKICLLLFFCCLYYAGNSHGTPDPVLRVLAGEETGATRTMFKVADVVTGTVVSSEGESLPGVNVLVKGTSVGTITDIEGRYSIDVPDGNETLVFSFIGYSTEEVVINNRAVVDVIMTEDIGSLDEVVVVGYGAVRKRDLTGAIASVDVEQQNELPNVSLYQSLIRSFKTCLHR